MKNIILLSLLFTINIFSATYFVKLTGNNSSNGLTINTAWQTIAKVNSSAGVNDSIYFNGNGRQIK